MISELSGDLFLGGKTLSFVETGIIQLDFGLVETTYRKNITCSQRSTMITKKTCTITLELLEASTLT
jgi:hypothetical protein